MENPWISEYQGQIKLPDPSGGGYGIDRKVNVSLDGQFHGRAQGPQVISGLAIGLGPVAGALDKWADVLAKQEEQKQKLEALDWTQAYQDEERKMLAEMAEMKSKDG